MKTEQDIAAMAEDKAFDELTAKQQLKIKRKHKHKTNRNSKQRGNTQ